MAKVYDESQTGKSKFRQSEEKTTLNGAMVICNAKSQPLKILWGTIFMFSLLGFVVHLSMLVRRYTDHPINVDTKYTSESIPFPDITICNTVAISLGKMMHHWQAFKDIGAFNNDSLEHFMNIKSLRNASQHTLYDIYRRVENMLYVSLSDQFGHGDYMIVQCLYKDTICNRARIRKVRLPGYGNCYTLPSPGDVEEAGEHGGYRMVLFTEGKKPNETWFSSYNDRFIPLYNQDYNMLKPTGMKIIVHDKDSYPHPGCGVVLSSGSFWNMAVEPTWTTRDPETITSCTDQDESNIKYKDYITGEVKNYRYSLDDCLKTKAQEHWYENCGCLSEDYPIPAHLDIPESRADDGMQFDGFCFFSFEKMVNFSRWREFVHGPNVTHVEQKFKCAMELLKLRKRSCTSSCECRSPCEERHYRVSLSQGKFGRDMPATHSYLHSNLYCKPPNRFHATPEYKPIIPTLENLCNAYYRRHPLSELNLLRENFLQLHIYFQSGIVKHVIESPAYPLSNLFSDIGGILGLYVGVSALTVCEIVQYCILWVSMLFGKGAPPSEEEKTLEEKKQIERSKLTLTC